MPNTQHPISTETLVLGSGYSGMAAAALLAHEGRQVTVLEAHETVGGCASFFRKGRYTFDVGATTFSGVRPDQPVGRLFGHLGLQPEFRKLDPAMLVRLPDLDVIRDADPDAWIARARDLFSGGDQTRFWDTLYDLEHRVWDLIADRNYLPPSTTMDWLRMADPRNIGALPLMNGLLRPMTWLMQRYGVDADPRFRRFVDEQMLISTQSTSAHAPYLTGAMGLTYPSETYYPVGGMVMPAIMLLRHITSHGGDVKFRRAVTSIVRQTTNDRRQTTNDRRWTVTCANGEVYHAKNVISSIPIWNMQHLTEGRVAEHYRSLSKRFEFSWAALTMYLALEQQPELPAPYIQMHLDEPIIGVDSHSLFLSVSHPDDDKKAPKGHSTITVSTHTRSQGWEGAGMQGWKGAGMQGWKGAGMQGWKGAGMQGWKGEGVKERVMKEMLDAIRRRIPEIDLDKVVHVEGGTPDTWVKYTSRYRGFVGGIPHTTKRSMLSMPKNVTPFPGLYQIGDSAFPGQGTPAVILGAWNTVARIFAS